MRHSLIEKGLKAVENEVVETGKMEERTSQYKEVPDSVHILNLVAKPVEYRSDGVDNASGDQHEELIVR